MAAIDGKTIYYTRDIIKKISRCKTTTRRCWSKIKNSINNTFN